MDYVWAAKGSGEVKARGADRVDGRYIGAQGYEPSRYVDPSAENGLLEGGVPSIPGAGRNHKMNRVSLAFSHAVRVRSQTIISEWNQGAHPESSGALDIGMESGCPPRVERGICGSARYQILDVARPARGP